MSSATSVTPSLVTGLRCADCGATFAPAYLLGCPACGGVPVVEYDAAGVAALDLAELAGPGIWRYAPLLPIVDPADRVTLGEGATPLLAAPRLGARLGLRDVWLKFEGANPTGSMKDRSSATAVAAARHFGFNQIGTVSSGNMGASIASYAARAGLRAFVFAAEYASASQRAHMDAATADFFVYPGEFDVMARAFRRLVDERTLFDGGTSLNPFNGEGLKTLAFEVVGQFGGHSPDVMVYPVGAGDLLLNVQRGFDLLARTGHTEGVPVPIVAQSEAAAPLVDALRTGGPVTKRRAWRSIAGGVVVGDLGRKGELALREVTGRGGAGGTATDAEILAWQATLARLEGVWAGPTACVVLPVLAKLAAGGAIHPDARVVVVLSETGLKSDAAVVPPRTIEPTERALRAVIGAPPTTRGASLAENSGPKPQC
ncbi:MAG: pyridoxal-phosphate dependent enzyme [Actinobacteria bacterium]|nr:pyridoxal-phosphate dependent enzyme [Actinomycetota bacterium]